MPFDFAVGIEDTFIPQERWDTNPPLRALDEFALMRHYQQWQTDLDLVASLRCGERRVTKMRWGVPWYRIETRPIAMIGAGRINLSITRTRSASI